MSLMKNQFLLQEQEKYAYKRRNYVELKTSTFTKNKNFVENLVTFRRTKHSKKKTYTFYQDKLFTAEQNKRICKFS